MERGAEQGHIDNEAQSDTGAASQSEIASPAAVVEILMTQTRTVIWGTFAATSCWVNTGTMTARWDPRPFGEPGERRLRYPLGPSQTQTVRQLRGRVTA
jgi:hypothetical protein